MLYFTSEVFRRLANQNRGHNSVMLECRMITKCHAVTVSVKTLSAPNPYFYWPMSSTTVTSLHSLISLRFK